MQTEYPNINALWSHVFVDELARCGLRHVVISPGSRSTPLVFAFWRHPDVSTHSVIDERAASFFALGLAMGSKAPAAVLCTSGTAAANIFPAVCEANLSNAPLLVITADRPVHLRDSGAPQTMDQTRLFGSHVRWFNELAQPECDAHKLRALRSTACYAMSLCGMGPMPGPVHINAPFRKPLEPAVTGDGHSSIPSDFLEKKHACVTGRASGLPWRRFVENRETPAPRTIEGIADALRLRRRILVIAGVDPSGKSDREAVNRFARATGVPVFAEAASQLRTDPSRDELILGAASLALMSDKYREAIRPDLILRLGGAPTTNPIRKFVAACEDVEQIAISRNRRRIDPDHAIATVVAAEPGPTLNALAQEFEKRPHETLDRSWVRCLIEADKSARGILEDLSSHADGLFICDAYLRLGQVMPAGSALVVSNSMPIRDLDTFLTSSKNELEVFCNRGVNGIDGMTAAALGIGRARGGTTVLVTGDIAFLHDLDGLLSAGNRDADLTIIVINNNGGEIFGLLPVRSFEPVFTEHFVTPHGMDIGELARAFGLEYNLATTPEQYSTALKNAVGATGVGIIEFRIDMDQSIRQRDLLAGKIDGVVSGNLRAPARHAEAAGDNPAGIHLAWHTLARGAGDAVPVVLLHGFTRSSMSWEPVVKQLRSDRIAYGIDLPGHGSSPSPDSKAAYDFVQLDEMLRSVLSRIGIERFHLVGYSMGGRVALHFAVSNSGFLASLALLSASPGIQDDELREKRRIDDDKLARSIMENGLERFVHSWSERPALARCGEAGEESMRAAKRERMSGSSIGYSLALAGLGQGVMPDLWDSLSSIAVPTLIAAGGCDENYVRLSELMAERMPNSRRVIVPGSGHDLPADASAAVAAELERFWRL